MKATAFDAKGTELDADEGFTFTASDAAIVGLAEACPPASLICVGDRKNNEPAHRPMPR